MQCQRFRVFGFTRRRLLLHGPSGGWGRHVGAPSWSMSSGSSLVASSLGGTPYEDLRNRRLHQYTRPLGSFTW